MDPLMVVMHCTSDSQSCETQRRALRLVSVLVPGSNELPLTRLQEKRESSQ